MKKLLFIIFAAISCMALAETMSGDEYAKLPPIDIYRNETQFQHLKCEAKFFIEQQKAELGESTAPENGYKQCIDVAKNTSKKMLNASLHRIKKPTSSAALKNYHVKFLAALEGIEPGREEIVIDYNRRQQRLKDNMNEAWVKFEVEQ